MQLSGGEDVTELRFGIGKAFPLLLIRGLQLLKVDARLR